MRGPKNDAPTVATIRAIRDNFSVNSMIIAVATMSTMSTLDGQMNLVNQHKTP